MGKFFIRAEISYKKKRGNQRIEEQPNKSYFEKRKEERERIKRGDVRIVLGASTDNDDKLSYRFIIMVFGIVPNTRSTHIFLLCGVALVLRYMEG